uniref:Uncharacterized protein n=1 Tax=Zea mays TaxID=4577 RepID=A0A804P2R5_MAIZE
MRSPSPAISRGDAPAPELAAIFRVMADLLGDPTWPQLHPWPCTDTPGARLDPVSLRGLPHLRTLSIFGSFGAA